VRVISVVVLHNYELLRTFTDFSVCYIVSEAEIDHDRLILICIDNSEVRKTRALQILSLCPQGVDVIVLTDDETANITNAPFAYIRSPTRVLRASEIFRAVVMHATLTTATSMDLVALSPHLKFLIMLPDHADALELQGIIEKLECTCVIVPTPVIDLTQLREGQFDAAILNRHLTLADGQIIGDIILSNLETYRTIPLVVALEAVASQTDLEWCRWFGLCFFLRKPFATKNVSDVLHLPTGQ
jgi:CheY-like chemotaxis protein